MTTVLTVLNNQYLIGAAVALAAQRWVVPQVSSALVADVKKVWSKVVPPKP